MAQYEVVHQQVTVLQDNSGTTPQEFRLTAPTGKDPFGGGYQSSFFHKLIDSYPDGSDWVFKIMGDSSGNFTADIYLTCL